MAVNDSRTIPLKRQGSSIKFKDGTTPTALELLLFLLTGSLTYSETGRNKVEVKSNDRRLATPVVVVTGDTDITGSFSVVVASFIGTNSGPADAALRQWLMGETPAFVSTGEGGEPQFEMEVTYDNSEDAASGVLQTATFSHVTIDELAIDTGGADDLVMMTVSFTARLASSRPVYA